jgi:hypothetical protein
MLQVPSYSIDEVGEDVYYDYHSWHYILKIRIGLLTPPSVNMIRYENRQLSTQLAVALSTSLSVMRRSSCWEMQINEDHYLSRTEQTRVRQATPQGGDEALSTSICTAHKASLCCSHSVTEHSQHP